jgi:hypothetical protein
VHAWAERGMLQTAYLARHCDEGVELCGKLGWQGNKTWRRVMSSDVWALGKMAGAGGRMAGRSAEYLGRAWPVTDCAMGAMGARCLSCAIVCVVNCDRSFMCQTALPSDGELTWMRGPSRQ